MRAHEQHCRSCSLNRAKASTEQGVQQLLRRAAAQLPCSRRALCYAMSCCVLTYFTASTLLSGSRPFKLSRLRLMTCVLVDCWWEQSRCMQQSFCNACLQQQPQVGPALCRDQCF